jgi:hypothetical protein
MVKAVVKNLRRVQTAVWIGSKRYVFPAGIKVRMNLTDEMVKELNRNHAFSVQVIGAIADASSVRENVPDPSSNVSAENALKSNAPEVAETPVSSPKSEIVEDMASIQEEIVETPVEPSVEDVKSDKKPDFFSMKKDELAAYLTERGVDPEGLSRKEMLKRVKEI